MIFITGNIINKKYSCLCGKVRINLIIYVYHRHQDVDIEYEKHQRTFQRIKRGVLPKSPLTIKELNAAFLDEKIFKCYGMTLHVQNNHKFFDAAIETENYSFSVFSSKATIELMKANIPPVDRHILMDATFRIVPVGLLYVRKQKQVSENICSIFFLRIFLIWNVIFFLILRFSL